MTEFPLSYLNGPELLTVAQNVQSILASSSIESNTVLQKLMGQVAVDCTNLSKILAVQRVNAYTAKLETADALFDKKFVTFRNYSSLMASQTSFPEIADAASKIVAVIRSVEWSLNYTAIAQELAGARAIVDQLSKEEYVAALAKCNAAEWYKQFSDAYVALAALYSERIDSSAVTTQDTPDFKIVKNDTRLHIEQVYNYCAVVDSIDKATYGSLAARLDEVVSAILPGARARKTRASTASAAVQAAPAETAATK